jgi:hypothetical protein
MGLLKSIFIFGIGVYGGIYACQNYEIPKIDDPKNLLKKLQDYLDKYKKED